MQGPTNVILAFIGTPTRAQRDLAGALRESGDVCEVHAWIAGESDIPEIQAKQGGLLDAYRFYAKLRAEKTFSLMKVSPGIEPTPDQAREILGRINDKVSVVLAGFGDAEEGWTTFSPIQDFPGPLDVVVVTSEAMTYLCCRPVRGNKEWIAMVHLAPTLQHAHRRFRCQAPKPEPEPPTNVNVPAPEVEVAPEVAPAPVVAFISDPPRVVQAQSQDQPASPEPKTTATEEGETKQEDTPPAAVHESLAAPDAPKKRTKKGLAGPASPQISAAATQDDGEEWKVPPPAEKTQTRKRGPKPKKEA